MEKKTTVQYENNPFYIGLNGIQLIFKNAQQVGIYAAVLAGVMLLLNMAGTFADTIGSMSEPETAQPAPYITTPSNVDVAEVFAVAGITLGILAIISVIVLAICLLLYGALEYTAAQLALGEKVTLQEAFLAVLKKFPGYLWLYILMFIKLFLWTLLLIIPGIIMSVRYSLASTVFFAENKKGNAAIKRSIQLTKGAWFTTFAGYGLWNFITLGQVSVLVTPAASTILYKQLRDVTDKGHKKPNAHWLSWLTFFVPIIFFAMIISFIALIALLLWLSLN